jgi:ADP-ribose pyrophosphatase
VSGPDATRRVYQGHLIDLDVETWGDHEREIVKHPGAVAIVAVDGTGEVTLVRQLREPARRRLLELPAGTLEPGEDPLDTARRELIEETGLHGGDWRLAARFWTTPGFCDEHLHLYVATGVVPGEASLEEDEEIELVRLGVDEIAGRLGEIEDAKTVVGLLLYLQQR